MVTLHTVTGVLGNIISIGLFASPLPTFWKIIKAGSTEGFSALPYICTLLNCLLWLFYGSPWVEKGILVITINGFGSVVEILYLMVFISLAATKKLRSQVLVMLATALAFFGFVVISNLTLLDSKKRRQTVVGMICIAGGAAMYSAPLSIVRTVIKTKSTKFMPFFLSLFSFFNGSMWLAYSLLGHDVFMAAANGLGTALAVLQLAVYACYCGGSAEEGFDAEVPAKKNTEAVSEKSSQASESLSSPLLANSSNV